MTHCDRCLVLEQQIRELKRELAPALEIPADWRLTRNERLILQALGRGGVVPTERLIVLLWEDTSRLINDPLDTLQVHMHNLRRKLARHGDWSVETHFGVGYRLVRPTSRPAAQRERATA